MREQQKLAESIRERLQSEERMKNPTIDINLDIEDLQRRLDEHVLKEMEKQEAERILMEDEQRLWVLDEVLIL